MLHTSIYLNYLLFRNGSRVRLSPWTKPRSLHAQGEEDYAQAAPVHTHEEEDRADLEEGYPAQAVPVHAQDPADLALAAPVHAHEEGDPAQAAPVDALEEEGEEEDPINVQTAPVHTHEGEGPAQAAPVDSHAAIMAEIEMH